MQRVNRGNRVSLHFDDDDAHRRVIWSTGATPGAPVLIPEIDQLMKPFLKIGTVDDVGDVCEFEIKETGFHVDGKYVAVKYPTVLVNGTYYYIDLAGSLPELLPIVPPLPLTTGCLMSVDPPNKTSLWDGPVVLYTPDGLRSMVLRAKYHLRVDMESLDPHNTRAMKLTRLPDPPSSCSIM